MERDSARIERHSARLSLHSSRLSLHAGDLALHSANIDVHSGRLDDHSGSVELDSPDVAVHSLHLDAHSGDFGVDSGDLARYLGRIVLDSGRLSLVLRRRGDVVEILAGSVVLLSSAALETELAFGKLVADLPGAPRRILVGGLGFGATVRGALEAAGPTARVTVVEKVAGVVDLVRGQLANVAEHVLDDPRVTVEVADVGDVIRAAEGAFDAILLDVDNGPEWASFRSNARLYTPAGLAEAHRALAPGGALAVWSGYPSDAFMPRLRQAGFTPKRILLRERGRVRARAYVGLR